MIVVAIIQVFLFAISSTLVVQVQANNRPGCPDWPTEDQWDRDLRAQLSDPALLHGPFVRANRDYEERCSTRTSLFHHGFYRGWKHSQQQGTDEEELLQQQQDFETILSQGDGLCMANHACVNQKCVLTEAPSLPAYSVEARTVRDIQVALMFCNSYDIGVAVKSSGHSFQGQSMQADALLIWTRGVADNTIHHNDSDNDIASTKNINNTTIASRTTINNNMGIATDFIDTCGTHHGPTLHAVAGENFGSALARVARDYNMVTGLCETVCLTGGWLQGGGLSVLSRKYGLGVDNVRSYQVVLADGSLVTSDACSHPDLFWALRGGGGGNYGIVVGIQYQLYPATELSVLRFGPGRLTTPLQAMRVSPRKQQVFREWIRFAVTYLPTASTQWTGGYILPTGPFPFYFQGSPEEARQSDLIVAMDQWHDTLIATGLLNTTTDAWVKEYPKPSSAITSFSTLYDVKAQDGDLGMNNGPVISVPARKGRMVSRFIPLSVTQERPEELIDLLSQIGLAGLWDAAYWLGGNIADIPAEATAVHPGVRDVVFGIELVFAPDSANQQIINFLGKDYANYSVSYNHHDTLEKNWQDVLFGPQYDKLKAIKDTYDPNHRFNVYHGVDFIPQEKMEKCQRRWQGDFLNVHFLPAFLKSFFHQLLVGFGMND